MNYTTDLLNLTCEDNMALMSRYPDKHFDLAIVDPPYGIERFDKRIPNKRNPNSKARKSFMKWENESSKLNDKKPSTEYFIELFRISKVAIIWGANNFNIPTTEYFCVWDKKQTVENFASAELAFVYGIKKPAKVFRYQIHKVNAEEDKIHPTQKPVALYKWLLKNYAKQGGKILDTHLGSMSIAIACHYAGFHLTGCELDPEYYEAGIKRVKEQTQQLKLI